MSQNTPGSSQKRPTIGTVVVVIGILLLLFVTRNWNDGSSSEEPSSNDQTVQQAESQSADSSDDADSESADAVQSDSSGTGADMESATESDNDAASDDDGGNASASRAPPGMATISTDELPPEALETMALIESDGPFPYSKDGSTFQNREGILPDEPMGYYAEYTVETPGSSDRGARRIVGGEEGELYYTDDHYASFSWIVVE